MTFAGISLRLEMGNEEKLLFQQNYITSKLEIAWQSGFKPKYIGALKCSAVPPNLSSVSKINQKKLKLQSATFAFSISSSGHTSPRYATLNTFVGHKPLAPKDTKAHCKGEIREMLRLPPSEAGRSAEISEPEIKRPSCVSKAQPPDQRDSLGLI